jgi:hypothetical protein
MKADSRRRDSLITESLIIGKMLPLLKAILISCRDISIVFDLLTLGELGRVWEDI